jgi:hypothetical protein
MPLRIQALCAVGSRASIVTRRLRSPRAACAALAVLVALATTGGTAAARVMPGFDASLGGAFAVSGSPDGGGLSFSISPMWPVEDRVAFGAMFFVDDMGTEFGRLQDPNDGTDLGAVSTNHGHVAGAAWRLDAEWGSLRTWLPFVSGTWGYYRVIEDVRGTTLGEVGSTGFSVAVGARRPLGGRNAVGASIRYHRLFNDHIGRYVGGAIDWSFR